MKNILFGFLALVLIGILFLIPKPAKASNQYTCVLIMNMLPSTAQDLYKRVIENCTFPSGNGEYEIVALQGEHLIFSLENKALGGLPPVLLSYPERSPIIVGVGINVIEREATFSFVKGPLGTMLNNNCTYREIFIGGGDSYWSVDAKSTNKECASLLWE